MLSDAILDDLIRQDPNSRVAVECLTTTGTVHVAGEVTTKGWANVQKIVRNTLKDIGYDPAGCPDRIPMITANGSIEVPLLKIEQIIWGNIELSDVPVICHKIPELANVDGLLGLSFLQHFEIALNFKQGILEIT